MQMGRRENLNNLGLLFIAIMMLFPMQSLAQNDIILLRDGTERKGKVVMVTNENTIIIEGSKKTSTQDNVLNKSIYMIKYEKRGNVFFTDDGKRISGEGDGKIPAGASIIYLLEGNEIIAYNVSMDEGIVQFYNSKKKGSPQLSIPSDRVFLIKYPDGTKDLMNDFEEVKRKEAEAEAERKRIEEEAQRKALQNQYPKDATIRTIKNQSINVILLSENDEEITYKKKGIKNSPVFHMNKTKIKDIKKNN